MKHVKKRPKVNTKNKKFLRLIKMVFLTHILPFLRIIIDKIIDFVFGLCYMNKKQIVPKISKSFLLESASSIAKKIRSRELTSEEVVTAFVERCKEVNGIINAITDQRYEKAIEEARQIDKDLKENKYSEEDLRKKPFLGVPFTTKESTACEGLSWSFALKSRQNIKAPEDATVVAKMKEAGGILIANTNIPEFNLWQETRNGIFGQTNNPYDTTRLCGGSSGGEAALIASCGSPIGIGTDIGGSIRMPCFFCGLFGHKPTSNIISTKGLTRRTGVEKHTMVVAGPIARYSEDLIPMLKVLAGPNVNQLKLDQKVDVKKLKFSFIPESGDIRCSPMGSELKEVMYKVVQHFNEVLPENTPVKKLEFEELRYSYRLWRYWMTKENLNFAHEVTNRKGEANVFLEFPKKIIGQCDYTLAALFKLTDDILPQEPTQWAEDTTKSLKSKFLKELEDNGVLLYPSYNWPAPHHYTSFFRPFNYSYWGIFNALKFPVTQVPLGLSKDGLPVGIQVVSAPGNDHITIAVASYLENVFGGYVPPFVK